MNSEPLGDRRGVLEPSSSELAATSERRRRLRRGRSGELAAVLLMLAKGYRPLARRVRTPWGEIDLICRRGKRLAFVEVKRRASLADAQAAITSAQLQRVARAAAAWVARRPHLAECEQGIDVVLVVPWRRPVHVANAHEPSGASRHPGSRR